MELFGVGAWELVVVLILALIFIGPRDMPRLAAKAAKFLRNLRELSTGFMREWQQAINELDPDGDLRELKSEYDSAKQVLSDSQRNIRQTVSDLQANVQETAQSVNEATKINLKAPENSISRNSIAPPAEDSPSESSPASQNDPLETEREATNSSQTADPPPPAELPSNTPKTT